MKAIKIISLFTILLTIFGCQNIENNNSSSINISTPTISNIEVISKPVLSIQPGSNEINFINGKIQVYIDDIADEEIIITKDMINNYDLFNRKLTINSVSNGHFFTKEIDFEGGIIIDNSSDLIKYLNTPSSVILLKNNIYNIAAGPKTTSINNEIVLIGESIAEINPVINITGFVSTQAAAIFYSNISIINVDFLTNNQYHALKFINNSGNLNNVFLENVDIEVGKNNNYSKGLSFYHIQNVVLKDIGIRVPEKGGGTGLSLSGCNVHIINSFIGNGTWGSIGIMAEQNALTSSIIIDDSSILESHSYVEDYQKYQESFYQMSTNISNFILKYYSGELFFVTYHLVEINSFQDLPKNIEGQQVIWYKDNSFQNTATETDFLTAEILYFAIANPGFQSIFNGMLLLKE